MKRWTRTWLAGASFALGLAWITPLARAQEGGGEGGGGEGGDKAEEEKKKEDDGEWFAVVGGDVYTGRCRAARRDCWRAAA